MGSPTVHVISTTKAELQTTLKSTLPLVNEPDARVIIVVSDGSPVLTRAGQQKNWLLKLAPWPQLQLLSAFASH
jgi:hypothetical protein